MKKLIWLLFLLPFSVTANDNIGICSTPLFLSRQTNMDRLIQKLKTSPDNLIIRNSLIKNFARQGIENLIRYRESCLKNIFIELLDNPDFYVRYKALYALRYYDNIPAAVFLPFLQNTNRHFKDMALSAMAEIKDPLYREFLQQYQVNETDPGIKASALYALTNCSLQKQKLFRNFNYEPEQEQLVKYNYHRSPEPVKDYQEIYSQIFLYDRDIPQADSFCYPVIDYEHEFIFSGPRLSYSAGSKIKHTGDDCAWFREGSSVYAIADGIIRIIHHSPDWGFLIVIEHQLSESEYICSIYGHLSKEIYVSPGRIVKKGEKIGTIGLSYSIENGGYGAHLHFGLAKGRWLKSQYNYAENLTLAEKDRDQKITQCRITPQGVEITYENGISLTLTGQEHSLSESLFWLKGYAFSKDLDRIWLDPKEFFLQHK